MDRPTIFIFGPNEDECDDIARRVIDVLNIRTRTDDRIPLVRSTDMAPDNIMISGRYTSY